MRLALPGTAVARPSRTATAVLGVMHRTRFAQVEEEPAARPVGDMEQSECGAARLAAIDECPALQDQKSAPKGDGPTTATDREQTKDDLINRTCASDVQFQ